MSENVIQIHLSIIGLLKIYLFFKISGRAFGRDLKEFLKLSWVSDFVAFKCLLL